MLMDVGPAEDMIGRAFVLYAMAGLELRRHIEMERQLGDLLDAVALTPEQAREVFAELAARRLLRAQALRQRHAARNVLWVARHRERAAPARAR